MIRINQIKIGLEQEKDGHKRQILENKIRKLLRLKDDDIFTFEIVKRSIDARKKPDIYYAYTVDIEGLKERDVMKRVKGNQISVVKPVKYRFPPSGIKNMLHRPVVVGAGPAGLFCSYMLALHGYRPILLERGMDVERRRRKVEEFWESGLLDAECNVQFGEGGAGTFSDGKLNTLVKDKEGRNKEVLSILAAAGAPEEILYDGKPHIGTDILADVVKNMRNTIISHGGEVYFDTKVTDLCIENGEIKGVKIERREWIEDGKTERVVGERIETDAVALAIGHSARDTFEMLYHREVPMEAKAFAVGLRVEHPQALIDESQYGKSVYGKFEYEEFEHEKSHMEMEKAEILPPAAYKLTAQTSEGRGVYSFCMCPGGYVVNASSEEGRLAVNGMSYSRREGENANSAIIVSVTPKDYGSDHPLGGIEFQRKLEERAYEVGKGKVPVEYYGDFKEVVLKNNGNKKNNSDKKNNDSKENNDKGSCDCQNGNGEIGGQEGKNIFLEKYSPQIKGRWQFGEVHNIMPDALNRAFVEGMEAFNRKISGFAARNVILSGIESRTSSPVRIHRNEKGQSEIGGLYPCGEGAGYAGGIMSAAMDGIRTAEQIARAMAKR